MIRRLKTYRRPTRQSLAGRCLIFVMAAVVGLVPFGGCDSNVPVDRDGDVRQPTVETGSWVNAAPAANRSENLSPGIASPSLASGADRVSQRAGVRSTAARQELRRVLARYQSATSYRDRAVVRMTYRVADQVQHDSAPLSVHYVAPDKLAMDAYSTRLEWRGGTLRAFIEAPEVNRLDKQLLKRSFKRSKIEVAKLYEDPVLRHFAAAGPGGPAPQIELLFGENPLAGFFAEGMRLDLGDEKVIDGRPCRRLKIEAEGSAYVLWIDRHDALIRRIELPSIEPPQMRADAFGPGEHTQPDGAEVALSIEFLDAEINGAKPPVEDRLSRVDIVTVDTFTLPPSPPASRLLGRKAEPFRLQCRMNRSSNETFQVSDRGSDREHTILLWVANHSGSRLAIEQLAAFADQLPSEVRRQCRFVVVQAEKIDDATEVQPMDQNSLAWAIDDEAIGRDRYRIEQAPALCVLDARGIVHWLQSPIGPEMTATLDGLLRDLYAGVDVGTMLRDQYETDLATYRQLLEGRIVE